ncbi:MAG: AAA family ATPase, partial [Methylocystis sp.]|nr:AAA family ATPase [Methylocystis sp.]
DLIGCEGLDGKGGMTWRDGALTKAIRRPGTIILLDEPTFAPPGTLAILQTLLDHRFITLTDGSVVRCAEGVSFVAADNTAGSGDASGVYAGTQAMNAALSDRFARHISIDYMPAAQETRALINHTGAPKEAAARVVQFLNNVRTAYARDGGARPVSLRQAVAFIRAAQDGFRPADAAEMVFYNRLPDADRETVRQLFRTQFDDNAFALEMDGRVITPQSQAPEQIKAREVFEETDVL